MTEIYHGYWSPVRGDTKSMVPEADAYHRYPSTGKHPVKEYVNQVYGPYPTSPVVSTAQPQGNGK